MMYNTVFYDCGREFSDFYDNTPRVSSTRNHAPRFIHLRWGTELEPCKAVVEFFNYQSIVPLQQGTTITSRDSFSLYPRTDPSMIVPISATIATPPNSAYFRIRLDRNGSLVTNMVPISNNNMYFYEQGMIYNLYSF